VKARRRGSAILWVALLLMLAPPAVTVATDLSAVLGAEETVGAALDEAQAVGARAPLVEQAAIFRQAFFADLPAPWRDHTALAVTADGGSFSAVATLALELPVPVGSWQVVWLHVTYPTLS
jgi:hypothetical protein